MAVCNESSWVPRANLSATIFFLSATMSGFSLNNLHSFFGAFFEFAGYFLYFGLDVLQLRLVSYAC
jgi:hypothetical protein